jgi:hypothetical protein
MKNSVRSSVSLLLISFFINAYAEDHMKPGLWQINHQGDMNIGGTEMKIPDTNQMQAMMQTLSPEMRAKMESYMRKNTAVAPSEGGLKACISPEQAARNDFPTSPQTSCKVMGNKRVGNTISVQLHCPQGDMDSTVTLHNPESWSGVTKGHMQRGTETYSMNMQAEGKWISADCGNLKPWAPAASTK